MPPKQNVVVEFFDQFCRDLFHPTHRANVRFSLIPGEELYSSIFSLGRLWLRPGSAISWGGTTLSYRLQKPTKTVSLITKQSLIPT